MNVPLFFDVKTPRPFIDPTIPWDRSIYPEDSGKFSVIIYIIPAPDLDIRGEEWRRSPGPHIHGCYGIRWWLLLLASDPPGV